MFPAGYLLRIILMIVGSLVILPPLAILFLFLLVGLPQSEAVRDLMSIDVFLLSFYWSTQLDKLFETNSQ